MSFAPVRPPEAKCKFFIDGEDYFRAIYDAISNAKKTIFICD